MRRIKSGILALALAGLLLGGLTGCGAENALPAAANGSAASGGAPAAASGADAAESRRTPDIPPNAPGPFAVYSGARPGTLDVFTKENGTYLVSLPYSMLADFPAAGPWSPSPAGAPVLLDGLHVYCGSAGSFIWAALGSAASMGTSYNCAATSPDGGETWQVGEMNAMCADNLGGLSTGANFISADVGLICFDSYGSHDAPGIARTLDGGKTWERLSVDIPADMRKYAYFTPQCPIFTGDFGVIPVICPDRAAGTDATEYLITTDGGMSWHWERDAQR